MVRLLPVKSVKYVYILKYRNTIFCVSHIIHFNVCNFDIAATCSAGLAMNVAMVLVQNVVCTSFVFVWGGSQRLFY